jgi:hypothetical protein
MLTTPKLPIPRLDYRDLLIVAQLNDLVGPLTLDTRLLSLDPDGRYVSVLN